MRTMNVSKIHGSPFSAAAWSRAVTMLAAEAKEMVLDKQANWGEECARNTKTNEKRILMDTMVQV